MRVRTYLGVLAGLLAVLLASYLTHHNPGLMKEPFRLGAEATIPLWVALLAVFLLGLLPPMTVLLVDSVRRDLAQREERKKNREAESLMASFRRAVDHQADGQWSKAVAELEVVLAARPNDFAPLLRYGEVLRRTGQLDKALDVHQRAAVAYPASVALLYQLAEDYDARGEAEVAREIRNRIVREFPGHGLTVLRRRRNAALGSRQFDRARELNAEISALEAAEDLSAEEREREAGIALGLEYQRGVSTLEREEIDAARAIFVGVLARAPRFIPAMIMLGEADLLADEEEAAIERWRAGFRATGSPVFLRRIEDHFIEGEEPRRAIETLRKLIADGGNDLLPRFSLGRLYYRLEMHEEALKVLDGLGERIGSSPTYDYLLGRLRERRGELALAAEAYSRAARTLGLPEAEYRCRLCQATSADWSDRCERCGAWNAVEMDFEEERLPPETLGLAEAVVLAGPESWDVGDLPEPVVPSPPAGAGPGSVS